MPTNAELLMGRDQRMDELMAENAKLRAANDALVAALEDCCTRMERARAILSAGGNWGMLDTGQARAALRQAKGE